MQEFAHTAEILTKVAEEATFVFVVLIRKNIVVDRGKVSRYRRPTCVGSLSDLTRSLLITRVTAA